MKYSEHKLGKDTVMIRELTDISDFEVEGATPFSTKAWLQSNLGSGESARVLVWTDERNPEAKVVAPFCIDSKRCLKFIGQEHADVNDVIVIGSHEYLYWAWKEICEAILEMKDVRRLCFEKMPAESPFAAYVAAALKGTLLYRAVGHSRVEASMRHLKQKDRSRIKALLAQPGDFVLLKPDASNLDDVLAIVDSLAGSMIGNGKRKSDFWGEPERSMLKAMWEAGLAEVPIVRESDGKTLAAAIRFVKNNVAWCWMAFTEDGRYLTQLYAKYISDVANRGEGWKVDFGSGTYGWKIGTFRPEIYPCVTLRWSRRLPESVSDWLHMIVRCFRV